MRPARRREPAPNVFRLILPLPFESLRWVNAYLLGGRETTLVDCGIHDPESAGGQSWTALEDALRACDTSVDDIERIVVTHPHADHYGMAARLVETTGAELWMHEAAPREVADLIHPGGRTARLRSVLGDSESDVEGFAPSQDWRPYLSGLVAASHDANDGDTFRAGTRSWRIIHTPGHARAHVCLWSESDALLVSGDHLLGSITPHIDAGDGREDPLGDYLSSLLEVEKLSPGLVLPGHGRPFDGGAERARATQRHHERRLGAILQVLRRGPLSLAEVTDEIFGTGLIGVERGLALGEALAHLDYLERRDEIETLRRDGVVAWRRRQRSAGRPE